MHCNVERDNDRRRFCPSLLPSIPLRAMTLKNILIAAFAMTAFLGAAVVAVTPIGGGFDFAMPFDVANR